MIFKDDINKRIEIDFGVQSNKAIEILKTAIEKTDYLNTDRIIRCIVFVSKGDLNHLQKTLLLQRMILETSCFGLNMKYYLMASTIKE